MTEHAQNTDAASRFVSLRVTAASVVDGNTRPYAPQRRRLSSAGVTWTTP